MIVVAVPVHNEAGHIAGLLEALAVQNTKMSYEVLLLLNNCTDQTAEIASAVQAQLPYKLRVLERTLASEDAHAGMARRLAMEEAAKIVGARGILLTTDADAIPDPSWIAAGIAAISAGAGAVAGCVRIDPADAAHLPRRLIDDECKVQLLTTLLDHIDWAADPTPSDPWPRHAQEPGASIAVAVDVLMRAGGIPPLPCGEDRAFFDQLRRQDVPIRHAPEFRVTVSGRLFGRATGGMADTMLRRMAEPDAWLDPIVEAAHRRLHRAALRKKARATWHQPDAIDFNALCEDLGLSAPDLAAARACRRFGEAWEVLQRVSPPLLRCRLAQNECDFEIRSAQMMLAALLQENTEMHAEMASVS